ncbi:DUF58 domain-containing protein [Planctomyces sp. SH-PL14]|uniref:DUF58 domain-containing protein n=1 Tax=Planctomyces sp. SH-PL14 TaxID=1632864 RepID=UPI00078E4FEB|nr:DUF58 domain-containing protein [Planctomyces sp. SH-PL14]AMV20850.1 hypothetical protein VT03_23310 [Planctomyces sp. SH-PL14]
MIDPRSLTDPAFFSRMESLELRARSIVEGFLTGLHRSPFVGFSVEFASHREYVPGDDPRYINWKLFSRQRRLYVKEFDAETNMNLYILLDVSGSMECANTGRTKLHYGASLAAALAHLALKQRDAVGVTLFADGVLGHLAPRAKPHQLDEILRLIATTEARPQSEAARALQQSAELCRHRGMVVIISDLFDDIDAIVKGLEHLRFRNHEVVLFHLWDPWERDLPLDGNIRFHDLETGAELSTRVEGIRDAYRDAVAEWRQRIEVECRNRAIDRVELTTDDPLDQALLDYLVRRSRVL